MKPSDKATLCASLAPGATFQGRLPRAHVGASAYGLKSRRSLLLALLCATSAACAGTLRNPFRAPLPPAPETLRSGAQLADVVAAVNQNADRLYSLQTTNAAIRLPGTLGLPLLNGRIAAMRPGRLRLEASTHLSGKEADLGAGDEAFWFWVRRNDPPALYTVRRDQMAQGAAAQLMPIDPQWLFDVLGFARLNPSDLHEGPTLTPAGALEVRTAMNSQRGPVTRVMVIDPRRAWILEQHVYDPAGSLLASAVASGHRYYPAAQISLPQKLELRLPAADLSLSIDLGTLALNVPLPGETLWHAPVIPGTPIIDLGNAPADAALAPVGRQLTASLENAGSDLEAVIPPELPSAAAGSLDMHATAQVGAAPAWVGGAPAPDGSSPYGTPYGPPQMSRLPLGGVSAELSRMR